MSKKSRRKKPRFSINVDSYYYQNKKWEKCRLFDLNLEGAGLVINQSFEKNDRITIKLELNGIEKIFKTKAVNVNGHRIGIIFINPNNSDLEYIKKVINELSKRYTVQ